MATYSVKILIEGQWFEYPAISKGFKRTNRLHNVQLRPCLNTCSLRLVWNEALWTLLLGSSKSYPIAIEKDGKDFFVGEIPSNVKDKIQKVQTTISFKVLDKANKLKVDITDNINYLGYKVCDPNDKVNSIVHQILYQAGYLDSEIDITQTIDKNVTVFSHEAGSTTYWKLLEELLHDHCYVFNSNDSGEFTLHSWKKKNPNPIATLGDDGISIANVKLNKKERKYHSVRLEWYKVSTIPDTLLYRDNIDIDSVGEAILPGFSYPVGSEGENVEQRYSSDWIDGEDPELLYSSNHTLDYDIVEYSEDDFLDEDSLTEGYIETDNYTVTSSFNEKSAEVSFRNDSTENTLFIRQFDIRATVIAKTTKVESKTPLVGNTKDVKSEHIEDKESADLYVSSLDAYYMFCDNEITLESLEELQEGYEYNLKFAPSSINTKLKIIQSVNTSRFKKKYKAILIDDITDKVITTKEIKQDLTQSAMIQKAIFENVADRPTFNDLIEGYDNYGMTTTPFKIEGLTAKSHLNTVELNWSKQINLSNLSGYRIQISENAEDWYSLGSPIGDLNAYTDVKGTFILHTDIPPNKNGAVVEPAQYFYRVAQVTVKGKISPWSDPVLGRTALIGSDSLVQNSILSNHIKAGEVKVSHMDVDSMNATTIGLLGHNTNPAVNMLDDSVHWGLRTNGRSNEGGELEADLDVIEHGHAWESEGEEDGISGAASTGVTNFGGYAIDRIIDGGTPFDGWGTIYDGGDPFTEIEKEIYGGDV